MTFTDKMEEFQDWKRIYLASYITTMERYVLSQSLQPLTSSFFSSSLPALATILSGTEPAAAAAARARVTGVFCRTQPIKQVSRQDGDRPSEVKE